MIKSPKNTTGMHFLVLERLVLATGKILGIVKVKTWYDMQVTTNSKAYGSRTVWHRAHVACKSQSAQTYLRYFI